MREVLVIEVGTEVMIWPDKPGKIVAVLVDLSGVSYKVGYWGTTWTESWFTPQMIRPVAGSAHMCRIGFNSEANHG